MVTSQQICITDIGSTTTKAILLIERDGIWQLGDIAQAPTTVEKPFNDVKIGVWQSIQKLEKKAQFQILMPDASSTDLKFMPDTIYLSTSSAGGGLQILVIGLTLADSASSAKRASYGAGGVILETFSIDDRKTSIEQMLAMKKLHPDMILLCGGTDGGALTGVIRLAEIIRIANPEPKYNSNEKIPLLYAGNQDALELIRMMVSDSFDLHLLPNLRPTMQTENLKPTQDLIQQLFMENVMEHAPGYKDLKQLVQADILPTPAGVLNSIKALCSGEDRNIFAFDIGGATTDTFSYISKHFQRTVSANLGMSYSALNVMKEAGLANLLRWLPEALTETEIRDYIGNKTLFPTSIPRNDRELAIEHALAREALRLSLEQHREMHYSRTKIGFLDNIKAGNREKFDLQFNFEAFARTFYFYASDIDVLVGAGGVFSHCKDPLQAVMILIDALNPKGVTEIWLDKHFITPHLGVLSQLDESVSSSLLQTASIEKLAVHISPLYKIKKKSYHLMDLQIGDSGEWIPIFSNQFYLYPAQPKALKYVLKAKNGTLVFKEHGEYEFESAMTVIIDTRELMTEGNSQKCYDLGLYDFTEQIRIPETEDKPKVTTGFMLRKLNLPYPGEILVETGNLVEPDQVVAINRYMPPRLYVVNAFIGFSGIPHDDLGNCFHVKKGDKIDIDHKILHISAECTKNFGQPRHSVFYSPVRGMVEYVNSKTGIVVISEIQDYAKHPVPINVATLLGIKPRQVRSYVKKTVGDFVYRGDVLAKRLRPVDTKPVPVFVRAPDTGKITKIDDTTGIVTITYCNEPTRYPAHVIGRISALEDNQALTIEYNGIRLDGVVGFGREQHGIIEYVPHQDYVLSRDLEGKIVCVPFDVDTSLLNALKNRKILALVAPAITQRDLAEFLAFDPGLINTGHEDLPYSLIIYGGFGKLNLSDQYTKFLSSAHGKMAFADPHTRIRAGVVRPFICLLDGQ